MKAQKNLSRTSLFIVPVLVVGFLLIGGQKVGSLFGQPQSNKRSVEERADPREPVQNLGIKVTGRPVKLSEDFDNGDDWLKNVTLQIKNRSDRPIIYIETDLAFFETQATGSLMMFSLRYGRRASLPEDANNASLRIEPGAVAELPLTDATFNSLKRFLSHRQALASLHKATLRLGLVVFDDGVAWSLGSFRCPDPRLPGTYYAVNGSTCP